MKKFHQIQGKIDCEMVTKLKDILADPICNHHVIYFTSWGGTDRETSVIVDMIKTYVNDGGKIEFVAVAELMSNGFNILFDLPSECVFYISHGIVGMAHLPRIELEMASNGRGYSHEDDSKRDHIQSFHNATMENFKRIGLNEDELSRVEKTYDVYLSSARMIEIFRHNNIYERAHNSNQQ